MDSLDQSDVNRQTDFARRYHEETKHSYWSIRKTPHYLDWDNRPSPFKVYPDLDAILLPRDLIPTGAPALRALSELTDTEAEGELTLERLASLLFYSVGVIREKSYPGGQLYFRAAACAGALYPIETYLVCAGMNGLSAGVYHFNPGDFSLRMLRSGQYNPVLAEAANSRRIASAPVTLVYTAISWRSTWKYRDRAYRYHYWDNGTILANTIAMTHAHSLRHELVMGFIDSDVNKLIGVDSRREFALSLLAVGRSADSLIKGNVIDVEPLQLQTIPLSASEVEYPSIQTVHRASSLTNKREVVDWHEAMKGAASEAAHLLQTNQSEMAEPIEKVIERRASTRRFARKAITIAELTTIVERCQPSLSTNSLYFIANDVEGFETGAYYFDQDLGKFELLKPGLFRKEAAYLTLEQDLGGDASVTFFLMFNLDETLEVLGNRGYRVAQMEGGIIAGIIYLTTYALGRGATGLTFYDDDVTAFFSPHAKDKSCSIAVSVGVPGKRPLF